MGHGLWHWLPTAVYLFAAAHSAPPDKVYDPHIIKTRSIDLSNAHGLSMESRLGNIVEPTQYTLKLEPYLEDGMFKGNVSIGLIWIEDSDEVMLHLDRNIELNDTEITIYTLSNPSEPQKVAIKRATRDLKKPIITFYLEKVIPKETTGRIDVSYSGNLETTSTEAFFKTTYLNENAQECIVAATQLRPNNARRLFPCFDEPGYKTPFQLSVVRPRNMLAFSNTPVARTEDIEGEPDAVWDHFERTPNMSTFTLGLVIADLKQLGNSSWFTDDLGNNVELRVWGRHEFLPALEEVNEKLVLLFKEIAQYWQVPLPLRKLDVVALPNYQGVKPADNWGLIVFKESELSNGGYLQLSQELLYQWLGALTTPAWWSDAHLNKALVGYLAAEIAFKINGGSEMEGKWPMTVLYSLYYEYGKRYPHSRITGMKQETACTKIELLFRMLNYTLGSDTFKRGLRAFIEKRKYKTFSGNDIWSSLNAVAIAEGKIPDGVDIKTVADSWIEKERLPLVYVHRNYSRNTVLLKQTIYIRERPHDIRNGKLTTWWIPIVMTFSNQLDFDNTKPTIWLKPNEQAILKDTNSKDHFILVNPEEIGPFPVNYDDENWRLIASFLQSDKRSQIPELTRAKLLHDAWNLAYAGETSFTTALNMTLFMRNERHHLVWDSVFTMIDHIGRHIETDKIQNKFQAYVRTLLSPLYEELKSHEQNTTEGWRKNLLGLTKNFLCQAGYRPCIREAQDRFKKWMNASNPDEGNPITNQYICPVYKWGSQEEWEFGLQRVINFPSSRKQSERTYLLKTLAGCPITKEKIDRLLKVAVLENNGNFTETDLFLIFSMLSGGSKGYTALFHFVNDNWDELKSRYAAKTNLWDNLISSATSHFTTQQGSHLVGVFYQTHSGEFGSATHIIERALQNMKEELKWSNENLPVLDDWLDTYLASANVHDNQFIGKDLNSVRDIN